MELLLPPLMASRRSSHQHQDWGKHGASGEQVQAQRGGPAELSHTWATICAT